MDDKTLGKNWPMFFLRYLVYDVGPSSLLMNKLILLSETYNLLLIAKFQMCLKT